MVWIKRDMVGIPQQFILCYVQVFIFILFTYLFKLYHFIVCTFNFLHKMSDCVLLSKALWCFCFFFLTKEHFVCG